MNTLVKTEQRRRLSFKEQTLTVFLAVVLAAVILPELFHVLGGALGLGTSLGEVFLPMHLPVILAGFLAGPCAGVIAGFFSPLISFAVSGMPIISILPFMMAELCAYGLFAGLVREIKIPTLLKVVVVQIAGRLVYTIAVFSVIFIFGSANVAADSVWRNVPNEILGLLLQWISIPLFIKIVSGLKHRDKFI